MSQFLAFILVTLAWAGVCRLMLEFVPVHPLAIAVVWLVGFVWMTGFIADGIRSADLLTKRWLQMLAGMGIIAGLVVLAIS